MSIRIGKIAIIGIVSGILQAQPISFGVKGGIPFTSAVEGSFGVHSEERRYTIGPVVEIGLPFSFAAEFDVLFKRTGYGTVDGAFGITSISRVRANSWEFPLLAKCYLGGHGLPVRPFVNAGYVARRASGVEGLIHDFGRDAIGGNLVDRTFTLSPSVLIRDNPTHGVTAGGGLQFRALRLRVSAEIRYTRWMGHTFDQEGSRGFFVRSHQNQTEFLVGLRF